MQAKYIIKAFSEFSIEELYHVLRLRNEVFIVEQNCPYQDLDDKDQRSLHLLYYVDDQLAAYTRLLPQGISYEDISIGRVLTSAAHRGIGLGKKLMEASIAGCYEKFGPSPIRISAQLYLLKFYQSLGFEKIGEPYDEDGIPHIEMVKQN
ncbi:GNAT family N-acetyltransferase [Pedobacter aquatilis]|uniref:GNAT family N-acetyltransferase n=1 Tax=Pedobacter aquatilis TaxID=351343 RepID=UPI00292DAB38|nr:GNAT family N-acetyltransferase [Pedobacter aquatilis]